MGGLFKKQKASTKQPLSQEFFEQLCRDGERGDLLIVEGKAEEGQKIIGTIFRRMMEARAFDEFLLAKVCLSSIISSLVTDRISTAHAIWTGNLPKPPGQSYALGIQAIETGVLDVGDTLIYQASGAFLHACNTDIHAARKAVDKVMEAVVDGAAEHLPQFNSNLVATGSIASVGFTMTSRRQVISMPMLRGWPRSTISLYPRRARWPSSSPCPGVQALNSSVSSANL